MSKSKVLVRIHQMLVASAEIQRPISLMMSQSLFMLVEMKIAMHQNQMLSSFPMKSGLNVPNNRKRRLRRNLLIQNTKLKWWALWQYSILTFIYMFSSSHISTILRYCLFRCTTERIDLSICSSKLKFIHTSCNLDYSQVNATPGALQHHPITASVSLPMPSKLIVSIFMIEIFLVYSN